MSCAQHREAIALLAGGELARSERAAVGAHLQECPACRRLLEEFRTGVALLKADPVVALPGAIRAEPVRSRRRRRPLVAAVAAALLAASLLHPQVRLAVAGVLRLPMPRVQEKVVTWRLPAGNGGVTEYVDADYLGTDYRVDPGPGSKVAFVKEEDEVRSLVGQSVLLPPREGSWCSDSDGVRVQYVTDQQGVLKYAFVESCAFNLPPRPLWSSAGAVLYEAQYWPGRPADKSSLVFGANWQVTTRDQTINGRAARIIAATNRVTGDYHSELWLQDGDWLYKLRNHNPEITTDMLVAAARALR